MALQFIGRHEFQRRDMPLIELTRDQKSLSGPFCTAAFNLRAGDASCDTVHQREVENAGY